MGLILNSFNESFFQYTISFSSSEGLSATKLEETCYEKSAKNCSSYKYFKSGFSLVQAAVDSSILSVRSWNWVYFVEVR